MIPICIKLKNHLSVHLVISLLSIFVWYRYFVFVCVRVSLSSSSGCNYLPIIFDKMILQIFIWQNLNTRIRDVKKRTALVRFIILCACFSLFHWYFLTQLSFFDNLVYFKIYLISISLSKKYHAWIQCNTNEYQIE